MSLNSTLKYNTYRIAAKDFRTELSAYFSVRNFVSVTFFYLLAYLSLFLADVYYADDHNRRYIGKITLGSVGRFVNEIVITLWNFSRSILDASPLYQIYSIFILSTISIALLAIFKAKTGILQLLSSTFVGIFPLYYSNMVYKVDAPFMSLSLLLGVLPFLCLGRTRLFYLASFLSAILILSTYQTSLSAYLMVFLFVLSRDAIARKKIDVKSTVTGILCFASGIVLYRFTLYKLANVTHVDNSLVPWNTLLSGLLFNFKAHAANLATLLGKTNIIIVAVIALLFVWEWTRSAQANKYLALSIAVVTVFAGLLMTGGLNIVLAHYPLNVRYYLLFSFFVGILAIIAANNSNFIVKTAFILFAFYFVNMDNGIGNALKTKAEYDEMIISHFVYDFKNIVGNNDYIIGDISGGKTTFPAIFNINNNPDSLITSHSRLVEAITNDMDYGIKQQIGIWLPLAKGNLPPMNEEYRYHLILNRPDYDIYFNDMGSYKIVFKFLSYH